MKTKKCKYCGKEIENYHPLQKYHKSCRVIVKKNYINEYMKNYYKKPEVKEKRKIYYNSYRQRPEYREKVSNYLQRPEVKQKRKKYQKEYFLRPEVKQKLREYNQRPEVKQKKNEDNKKRYKVINLNWKNLSDEDQLIIINEKSKELLKS